MKLATLTVLALLLSTVVAVAVVPQLRQRFFLGGAREGTVPDTITVQPTVDCEETPVTKTVSSAPASRRDTTPMEYLPPLDAGQCGSIPDSLSPLVEDGKLTIYVDGNRLLITGATGETVRVYDISGSLVATGRTTGVCILNLFACTNVFSGTGRYRYRLQIGDRPALVLQI